MTNDNPILSIGMATYNDYDGVYFTIQSLRLYHSICNTDDVEFIIIDNNPDGNESKFLKQLINRDVKEGQYIPVKDQTSSFVKYRTPDYATGQYIIIMDCHVLLVPGAIKSLLQYYDENPNTKNLIQGPMLSNSLTKYNTHWKPEFRGNMYGCWSHDEKKFQEGNPFEIPMQGNALLSFNKDAWHGINPNFKGFGGEQGYIQDKFRQWGGKCICLPQFQWVHRFGRPNGVPFKCSLDDRVWNYFLGYLDLYKDPNHDMITQIYDHFKTQIPGKRVDYVLNKLKKNPRLWM